MSFDRFFTTLSQTANDQSYQPVFGGTGQTISLSSNLMALSAEAGEIVTWIRYKLGEPKLTVELDNLQIFAAFEESNIEYSAIVNQYQAKNWLFSLMGVNGDFATADISGKLPYQTFTYLKRITSAYSTEAGVGGVQNVRKGYVRLSHTGVDYSVSNDFVDQATGSSISAYLTSVGQSRIEIKKMWHYEPPSIYRFYDPYSSATVLNNEFNYENYNVGSLFYVFPIWVDVLRSQLIETTDRVRRSNYTYHLYGDRMRIIPKPANVMTYWIEYTTDMNPYDPDVSVGTDPSLTGISNISNVPFKDISYTSVNAAGKRWIRQFTYGLSMQILGRIRRKYGTIPVPGAEIQLDGDALVSEGREVTVQLTEELKKDLEDTLNVNLFKQESELAQQIEEQYKRMPLPVPIYIM